MNFIVKDVYPSYLLHFWFSGVVTSLYAAYYCLILVSGKENNLPLKMKAKYKNVILFVKIDADLFFGGLTFFIFLSLCGECMSE